MVATVPPSRARPGTLARLLQVGYGRSRRHFDCGESCAMAEGAMMEAAPSGGAKPNPPPSVPAATEESERNPIFDSLVGPDGEIAGLVAYSIYKQNKRAWLDAFIKATKRIPTEAETRSYIIGESTERRLATYRQLAAATLGGQSIRLRGVSSLGRSGRLTGALWSLVALAALVVIGLALRYSGK